MAPPSEPASPAAAANKKEKKVHVIEEAQINQLAMPAIGNQVLSKRNNAPSLSFGKATRKQREKIFISKEASEGELNADTPGAIYSCNSTLNLETGQKFGTGPQRTFGRWKNKYDYETKKIDRLGEITARANRFRYPKQSQVVFTTEPIGQTKNIEIFYSHPVAFQGLDSPGPHAYPKPSIEVTSKYKSFSKMPFGVKTDIGSMYKVPKGMNLDIGPNSYPPMTSMGKQHLSQRHNAITYKFLEGPKFGKPAKQSQPTQRLDINLSSLGRQISGARKTEPLVGFSQGTRDQAQRITRCLTERDSGRSFCMPDF